MSEVRPSIQVDHMTIAEFKDEGYLQELNRKFLHPLGLALEVVVDENGNATEFGGVWDFRDDAEGIIYGGAGPDIVKAKRIRHYEEDRKPERIARVGYWIQPADAD